MSNPTKPYTLTFDEKPKYLYVRVKCDTFTPQIALDYLSEVLDECRELNYSCLLIDRDIPEALTPSLTAAVASKLAETGVGNLKIAVVDPLFEDRERSQFSRSASRGMGIRVRAYKSVPDARRWLLYGLE